MKHALRVLILLLKVADSGPSIYKSLKKNNPLTKLQNKTTLLQSELLGLRRSMKK